VSRQPAISVQDVRSALSQLRAETDTTGRPPSVLALARRLGLPNTSLRRRFPDICTELAAAATPSPPQPPDGRENTYDHLTQEVARLRRDNRNLTDNLELAIANIQRLTLESHQLRLSLEAALKVTRLT
jgi:hypothetical protein